MWKLKTRVTCPHCSGVDSWECTTCDGVGKLQVELPPQKIEEFLDRPESVECVCVCGKKEIILRPQSLSQIPVGWVNWSNDLVCPNCKANMVYAALIAAQNKLTQIKEKQRKNAKVSSKVG
jgi:hypothetical protein